MNALPSLTIDELEHLQIDGFVPVIIQMIPATNLPFLLGLTEGEEDDSDFAQPAGRDPMEERELFVLSRNE